MFDSSYMSKSHVSKDHTIVKTLSDMEKRKVLVFCKRNKAGMKYGEKLHVTYGFLLKLALKLWYSALEIYIHEETNLLSKVVCNGLSNFKEQLAIV